MDFDQLRYFVRIAELGNFSRTAEELGISQPALSRSIQRLEEELGQPVFERKSRSVGLTDTGTLLLSRAQQILAIIEDTKAEISDDGQSGRIRLGAIPTIAPYFLPSFLREFSGDFPKAALIVQEDTTNNLLKRCKEGEIDVAILALPIPAKYLEIEELLEEELLLVLPPEHVLAKKKRIELEQIENYPFVLLDETHCLSDNVMTFCRQKSFHPVSVERTSQLAMVQELVSLSHGVSMIPAMARAIDHSDKRVYRSLSGTKPTRTLAAVYNPYRFHSKLLGEFASRLKDYAKRFSRGKIKE